MSVIESIVFLFNEKEVSIELETIPQVPNEQTSAQRQVRFIEKAKRIKHNLALIEEYLIKYQKVQMEQTFNFIYTPPDWSVPPLTSFSLEVRESNYVLNKISLTSKGHYLLGRYPACDIILEDVTCSRQHAVVQFRPGDFTDEVYIYDLKSTSGTYVNGMALQPLVYYPLLPGDSLQFGRHSSTFILCHTNQRATHTTEPKSIVNDAVAREITESVDGYPPNVYRIPDFLDQFGGAKTPSRKHSLAATASRMGVTSQYTDPRENFTKQKTQGGTLNTPASYNPRDRVQTHHLESSMSVNSRNPTITHSDSFANTTPMSSRGNNNNSKQEKKRKKKEKNKRTPLLDPKVFNAEDYKRSMVEKYERQKKENEENLKLKKERDAQGLPPIIELPHVPERPKMNTVARRKDKKRKWWCISRK